MTNRFTLPTVTTLAALTASGLIVVGLAGVPAAAASPAPPTGTDREFSRAVEAALVETGAGVATSFEAGRSGYDVEVRLADGSDVDVDLDAEFAVVRVRPDLEPDNDSDPVAETVDLARAYDAVIAHVANERVGGGTVASIELDDDGGYDADVTLDDGAEIEVHLDDTFDVLRTERDDD
jgi:uncharacterized membrane protein YkoI